MGGVRPEGKKGKKTTTTRRGRGWGERQETEIMLLNCRIVALTSGGFQTMVTKKKMKFMSRPENVPLPLSLCHQEKTDLTTARHQ